MKKLKSLIAVLLSMAFMLLLAGCGDEEESKEEKSLTSEYLYNVIARVPLGETYNNNGLNMSIESAEVSGGSVAYHVYWKCKMDMTHEQMGDIRNFVYENGRHISYYAEAPDVERNLIREKDADLEVVTGGGAIYDGSYVVTVYQDDSQNMSLNSAKYTVEIHPTWDGWPKDQSVVFELN